jgi:hypothetical protein
MFCVRGRVVDLVAKLAEEPAQLDLLGTVEDVDAVES